MNKWLGSALGADLTWIYKSEVPGILYFLRILWRETVCGNEDECKMQARWGSLLQIFDMFVDLYFYQHTWNIGGCRFICVRFKQKSLPLSIKHQSCVNSSNFMRLITIDALSQIFTRQLSQINKQSDFVCREQQYRIAKSTLFVRLLHYYNFLSRPFASDKFPLLIKICFTDCYNSTNQKIDEIVVILI